MDDQRHEQKENEREEEYPLPPRSTKFPSERKKVTLFFYRSLFVLFLLLTAALIGWGLTLQAPYE
jgi:hypothetical protein